MSYLIFGKVGSTLAESDHPNGSPRVRIVDFRGDATRRFVCEMQRPNPEAFALSRIADLESEWGIASGELIAVDVTAQEYDALNHFVYDPIRTADENARAARRDELRAAFGTEIKTKADVNADHFLLRVPTAPAARAEFFKGLYLKLKEIEEGGILEEI